MKTLTEADQLINTAIEKFEIALAAIKGEVTLNEICNRYQVAPSQVHVWEKQFLEQSQAIFDKKSVKTKAKKQESQEQQQKQLFDKIGQLTIERDFLKKLGETPREQRRELIEQTSHLSLRRQCDLLSVNRSSLYYQDKPPEVADIDLLNIIRDVCVSVPLKTDPVN